MSKHIAVIGAGSWGTAVAIALSENTDHVMLWGRNTKMMEEISMTRENKKYLPGITLNERIECTSDLEKAVKGTDEVIFVIPAQHFREVFADAEKFIKKGAIVVNCAKGIEISTLKRVSEIIAETREDLRFVVLSGPSHAEEVGRCLPTTLVAASDDPEAAARVQDLFMSKWMRVYTNDDVIGVETGGALKNIIALAAGISDGMGYGDNAKAALMTRGLAEMARLGEKTGGKRMTFMGLAGMGDLIVTCTSMHSRNRRCGILIGEGNSLDDAVEKVGMVVEGVYTTEAAYKLARMHNVEMPVVEELYNVIHGITSGTEAVDRLMGREKKNEEE